MLLTTISETARTFRLRAEDPSRFLETCDGGDLGSPDRRTIWLLGIEPGWSVADQLLDEQGLRDKAEGMVDYSVETQIAWPFNRKAFQLLAALNGLPPENYRDFAFAKRPFERGSKGYFKANLFPEPFNKVGDWDAAAIDKTGFGTKEEYRDWLKSVRFPVFRSWIEKHRLALVIGTGLSHLDDFLEITGTAEKPTPQVFDINGHRKRMYGSAEGVVPVAVLPHLSGNTHSLNSYQSIREVAERILATVPGVGSDEAC